MLTVRKLDKKDFATAARYGAEGMHFDWYAHGWGLRLYRWFFFYEMLNKATRAWGCYYRGYFQGALLARIEGEAPLYKNSFISVLVKAVEWLIRHFDIAGMDDYDKANEDMLSAFIKRLDEKAAQPINLGTTTNSSSSSPTEVVTGMSPMSQSSLNQTSLEQSSLKQSSLEQSPLDDSTRRTPSQKPSAEILFLTANPKGRVRGVGTALLNQFERAAAGRCAYLYTDTGCTYPFYEHRGFVREGEKNIEVKHGKSNFTLSCFLYAKQL